MIRDLKNIFSLSTHLVMGNTRVCMCVYLYDGMLWMISSMEYNLKICLLSWMFEYTSNFIFHIKFLNGFNINNMIQVQNVFAKLLDNQINLI